MWWRRSLANRRWLRRKRASTAGDAGIASLTGMQQIDLLVTLLVCMHAS
jgi:hypothetical protein